MEEEVVSVVRGEGIALVEDGAQELGSGSNAVVEGDSNAVEKEGSITMVVGGAWTRGASGGGMTEGEGMSAQGASSHARKSWGISGKMVPYFASRYSAMPSRSSLTDGRELTFTWNVFALALWQATRLRENMSEMHKFSSTLWKRE